MLASPERVLPGLTPLEADTLNLISYGQTISQVARQLETTPDEIHQARRNLLEHYDTESTAAMTHRAIRAGDITIDVEPDNEVLQKLTDFDRQHLRVYANGATNKQLAHLAGCSLQVVESYHDRLLGTLKAWSRAHAIRRAYELGTFPLD